MKIMFIGLGLIGGSMAMALEGYPDLECYAVDGDEPTRLEALGRNVVRAAWPNADDAPIDMDNVVICTANPEAAATLCAARRAHQARRAADGCLRRETAAFEAVGQVENRPFIYLGGHPMSGAGARRFCARDGVVPQRALHPRAGRGRAAGRNIHLLEQLVTFMGCADVVFSDPRRTDERIAYTSQLMHVMALALCDQHLLFDQLWV